MHGLDRVMKHEPRVMPHVRVREKDAIEHRTRGAARGAIEREQLRAKVWRRVDHPAFAAAWIGLAAAWIRLAAAWIRLAAAWINDAEACDESLLRWIIPARVAETSSLRNTAILRDSQHNQ